MLGEYIMDMGRVLTEWYRLIGEKQRKAKDIRKQKEIDYKRLLGLQKVARSYRDAYLEQHAGRAWACARMDVLRMAAQCSTCSERAGKGERSSNKVKNKKY